MELRIGNIKNTVLRWKEEIATQGDKTALTSKDVRLMEMLLAKAEEWMKEAEECLTLCEDHEQDAGSDG